MTDTTATEGEAVEAEGAEATPEQVAQRALVRSIARALCRIEGKGGAEMKTRWTEKRTEYVGTAKKLSRAFAKEGLTLSAGEATEADAED